MLRVVGTHLRRVGGMVKVITHSSEVSTDHRHVFGLSQRALLSEASALRGEEIECGLNGKTSETDEESCETLVSHGPVWRSKSVFSSRI